MIFIVLTAKKERDEWVDRNAYNSYGKRVAASTTLEKVRYCKGRNFKVCNTVVIQNEYEIDDYVHGKEIKE